MRLSRLPGGRMARWLGWRGRIGVVWYRWLVIELYAAS
jgi:hypothetical protein